MKFQHILLSIIVFVYSITLKSQTVEPSSGIDKNKFQIELETVYSSEKIEHNKNTSLGIPNILVRYGLSNTVELQFHTPFTKERSFVNNKLTSNIFKFDEVELGLSVNLWKQQKLIPEAALMARIISPTKKTALNKLGKIVSLNFSNQLSNKISVNYNIGYLTDTDQNNSGFYILNLSYEPTSKIHFFAENSTDFNFDKTLSNCISTGFGLNLKENFSLDLSLCKSLKHNMYIVGAIATWVLPKS